MGKTAIILGATGFTGQILLNKLIEDTRYNHIKLFSRVRLKGLPDKVTQITGNLLELEQYIEDFNADEVYCCIGSTAKKTPNKDLYRHIDFGIPVAASKLAKANNIETFLVISAMGANKNSRVFYNKIKGEMEEAVLKQNINKTYILRPSLIGGKRQEQRTLERIGIAAFKFLNPLFIGPLKHYKVIHPDDIAQAMINLANSISYTQTKFFSDEIKKIAVNK